jgi:hypothetical protein
MERMVKIINRNEGDQKKVGGSIPSTGTTTPPRPCDIETLTIHPA